MLTSLTGSAIGAPYNGTQWLSREASLTGANPLPLLRSVGGISQATCRLPCLTGDMVATLALYEATLTGTPAKDNLLRHCKARSGSMVKFGTAFSAWLASNGKADVSLEGSGCLSRLAFVPHLGLSLAQQTALAQELTEITHNNKASLDAARSLIELTYEVRRSGSDSPLKYFLGKSKFKKDCLDMHNDSVFVIGAPHVLLQASRVVVQSRSIEDVFKYSLYVGGNSCAIASIAGILAEPLYPLPAPLKQLAKSVVGKCPELSSILNSAYPR